MLFSRSFCFSLACGPAARGITLLDRLRGCQSCILDACLINIVWEIDIAPRAGDNPPMDADSFYAEFGRLLQKARRSCSSRGTKLTQADLADAVGISRASIANIERGQQRVQLHLVARMAEILSVDIVELVPRPSLSADSDKIAVALQGQGASPKDIQRALVHLPLEGRKS